MESYQRPAPPLLQMCRPQSGAGRGGGRKVESLALCASRSCTASGPVVEFLSTGTRPGEDFLLTQSGSCRVDGAWRRAGETASLGSRESDQLRLLYCGRARLEAWSEMDNRTGYMSFACNGCLFDFESRGIFCCGNWVDAG